LENDWGCYQPSFVFVDEALIDLPLKASKLRKKEVIEAGLKELVREKNRDLLRGELGTFDMVIWTCLWTS